MYKWIPENFKGIIATVVIISSFSYFFLITVFEHKADPQVIIAIVAISQSVVNYYFGSSQGANKKDQIIQDMQNEK